MKVDKQLPAVTPFALDRQTPDLKGVALQRTSGATQVTEREAPRNESTPRQSSTYGLQLNQQLSAMQSASSYLSQVQARLSQLKLKLGRQLSAPAANTAEMDGAREALKKVNAILQQRSRLDDNVIDPSYQLKLTEPVRVRFSLQGLESIDQIQQAGQETLVFTAGRKLPEPLAVVLDEGLNDEQILRRFNVSLGQAGLRAELDNEGQLKFSARESDWTALRDQLAVRGEGKLFAKDSFARVDSAEDGLLGLPSDSNLDSNSEMRQILDNVIAALDRIAILREQIREREADIRQFLREQLDGDEQQWAQNYLGSLLKVLRSGGNSYIAQSQIIVGQANLNRYNVVSLLA